MNTHHLLDPEEIPPEITAAANLVAEWFDRRGIDKWELMSICSRNHAPPHDRTSLADAYARMISETTEWVCTKRTEEIEGRAVTIEEVRKHGEMQVTEESGITLYLWKGQPICEYTPARFTLTGWRNASVKELSPVAIPIRP